MENDRHDLNVQPSELAESSREVFMMMTMSNRPIFMILKTSKIQTR
jgi:hypothetical protein